jgi:hypothetical protein
MTNRFAWVPVILGFVVILVVSGQWGVSGRADDNASGSKLAHNVYFTLKDKSPEAQKKLVDACKRYLSDHPGTAFFAAGTVSDLNRPVNDRDWEVGLHIVFRDRAAHDRYQDDPKHLKFIEENKDNWEKVRVFDTDCR